MLASLQNAANVARWAAYGIDITSAFVANSTGVVSLITHTTGSTTASISGERYVTNDTELAAGTAGDSKSAVTTSTYYGVGTDDLFTFSVGSNSVTVSPGGAYGGSQTATTLTAIGDTIASAWKLKYGSGGTASGSAVATITSAAGIITITSFDKGTAGNALDISLSVAAGTVTATNAKNINWLIGGGTDQTAAAVLQATSDNKTAAEDVLLTMTVASGATDVTASVSFVSSVAFVANVIELKTTRLTNSAQVSDEYTLAQESADAIQAEGASAGTADTTAAISFSRVGWLG
jgi:hypothetical protein